MWKKNQIFEAIAIHIIWNKGPANAFVFYWYVVDIYWVCCKVNKYMSCAHYGKLMMWLWNVEQQ